MERLRNGIKERSEAPYKNGTGYKVNKMIRAKILTPFFLITVFASVCFSAPPDIYMNILRSGDKKISVAIPDFRFLKGTDYENFSARGSSILSNDLKESEIFSLVENRALIKDNDQSDRRGKKIDFSEWKALGAETLVKGKVLVEGGEVIAEFSLYDVVKGKSIISRQYRTLRKNFRKSIHRFADEVVFRFTGEKGVARTKIVFVSRSGRHKELYICDYDGKRVKRLTNHRSIILFPAWSPDANSLVFASYKDRNPDLFEMDIRNLRSIPISTSPGLNAPASWSPGGTKLALVQSRYGSSDIFVLNTRTSRYKRLTHKRSIETSPAWSPKKRLIAYTSDRSGSPQIYLMSQDGSGQRRVTFTGTYNDQADWSPDGSMLAYSSLNNGHFNICVINLADGRVEKLTMNAGDNQSPSWSPDGKKIAFSSDRDGSNQIYVMNSDGTGQRQLLFVEGGGYSPAWSPVPVN